jgi:hypothetical protein
MDAVRIGRISDDTGTAELLKTTYNGTDQQGNLVFCGQSPNGSSVFGMLTAKATAIKQEERPEMTIQPFQRPAVMTEVGLFGWLTDILQRNPVVWQGHMVQCEP